MIDVQTHLCNQQVGGSSPSTSSNLSATQQSEYGGIPEWPKGADCKSVVSDFGGSNPPSPTKNSEHPSGWSEFFDFRRRWIRKAALSGMPVACRNRRGFSAEKESHPHYQITGFSRSSGRGISYYGWGRSLYCEAVNPTQSASEHRCAHILPFRKRSSQR